MLIGLIGCASPQVHLVAWDRPETNYETFYQDRYACLKEAQQGESTVESRSFANQYFAGGRSSSRSRVIVSAGFFQSCMMARGYRINPNGKFYPEGGTVELR